MVPMNPSINKNGEKLFEDLRKEMATLNSAINALKFCMETKRQKGGKNDKKNQQKEKQGVG